MTKRCSMCAVDLSENNAPRNVLLGSRGGYCRPCRRQRRIILTPQKIQELKSSFVKRDDRIASQLGMSHTAAAGKLRKIVIFHLLKKLKEDFCYVCKKPILSIDELSIEHIKPWEGRSSELFWDTDNISFSHRACNQPHSRRKSRLLV